MSLYNLTKISGNDPLKILQGFNTYTDNYGFNVFAFAIFASLFIAIYTRDQNMGHSLLISAVCGTLLSTLLFFAELVSVWVPFVYLSLIVVGIFTGVNKDD